MNSFLTTLKRIFLPFEFEDHSLFYQHPDEEELDRLWAEIEDAPYQAKFTISSDPDKTHYL